MLSMKRSIQNRILMQVVRRKISSSSVAVVSTNHSYKSNYFHRQQESLDKPVITFTRKFTKSRNKNEVLSDLAPEDPIVESAEQGGFEGLASTDMDFYDPLTDNIFLDHDDPQSEENTAKEKIEEEARRKAVRDDLDSRTGRLWTDPYEITHDDWGSGKKLDDLLDWTPNVCSRISLERVQVFPDGVPTLERLVQVPLPPPYPPHPALGNPNPYLKYKKQKHYDTVYAAVSSFAEPKIDKILNLSEWTDKQDAIDSLFEEVFDAIKEKMDVLQSMPNYPELVERSLEDYLRNVVKKEKSIWTQKQAPDSDKNTPDNPDTIVTDAKGIPIFMDLLKVDGFSVDDSGIPTLVRPLKPHKRDGPGRMIEEWELAANQDTKRILTRCCIRDIAKTLSMTSSENATQGCRIYVKGPKGSGKSAALLAVVAVARRSGHIVLFLPDGDRLRKHGFYSEVNSHYGEKMFDLPILAKEICSQLLETHENDMTGLVVTDPCLTQFMTADQKRKLLAAIGSEVPAGTLALVELLKVGADSTVLSASCYGAALQTLMSQTSIPFTIVLDEFNCYYDHGHYFHEDYDPKVRKSIPLNRITLFRPLLDAFGVHKNDHGKFITTEPILMKRGGIIVGLTESHAVARKFTDTLTDVASLTGVQLVDVPNYSPIEVEHILANFETIGIGRLRFDRGATVMDSQEVAFLRMISCGVGQKLLDACIT